MISLSGDIAEKIWKSLYLVHSIKTHQLLRGKLPKNDSVENDIRGDRTRAFLI